MRRKTLIHKLTMPCTVTQHVALIAHAARCAGSKAAAVRAALHLLRSVVDSNDLSAFTAQSSVISINLEVGLDYGLHSWVMNRARVYGRTPKDVLREAIDVAMPIWRIEGLARVDGIRQAKVALAMIKATEGADPKAAMADMVNFVHDRHPILKGTAG